MHAISEYSVSDLAGLFTVSRPTVYRALNRRLAHWLAILFPTGIDPKDPHMPPAVLAWLDYSEADQRRAREIIRLFSQPDSRDELGIGSIRDALSDTLFPGTSVLLTRARYFLFVPWLYMEGARLRYQGTQLASWVDGQERRLIGKLSKGGDSAGMIGGVVGEQVQNLPSTIYWNSLRRFGILRHAVSPTQVGRARDVSRSLDDVSELVERPDAVWDPSMPASPKNFIQLDICDFALTLEEATWLTERISAAAPGTLLQFLVVRGTKHAGGSRFAWEDPEVNAATGQIRDAVDEARRFSVVMHGAALLYNVLLAERAEDLGLKQHEGKRDAFADDLDEWRREIEGSDLRGWDLNQLWALVEAQGRMVSLLTRDFVTQWLSIIQGSIGQSVADLHAARELVRRREIRQKRGQARLTNDRLMQQWGGASGTGRLNFRWPVVARLLNDIADGQEKGHAGS